MLDRRRVRFPPTGINERGTPGLRCLVAAGHSLITKQQIGSSSIRSCSRLVKRCLLKHCSYHVAKGIDVDCPPCPITAMS